MHLLNQNDMPKVTIALITYNRAGYLTQAIDAVLLQTYRDFELIIMDNGSTVETYESIKPYLSEQVKYHRNPINNREYANEAFSLATGEFLLITHDDDMMMPTMLEREVELLNLNTNCVLVGCNVTLINEDNKVISQRANKQKKNHTFNQYEYIKSFFSGGLVLFCPTILMRRSFFDSNCLNYDVLGVGPAADSYLWFEVNLNPVQLALISEPLYNYRIHSNQDWLANANTMEFILFPKTIDLLLSKMSIVNAKPYLKLIIHKSIVNTAFAYYLKKITKQEFVNNIIRYKAELINWSLISTKDKFILFFIKYFNLYYIFSYKIYVRIKKL